MPETPKRPENGAKLTVTHKPSGESYTGTVEEASKDGFLLANDEKGNPSKGRRYFSWDSVSYK